ncbi:MAG: hypothetical protein N3G21_13590, partial [Candidatus Hydrogenedentes bacterium]|nr:hypothetical protein [Candidatus Hydrogenedentota bacterium]
MALKVPKFSLLSLIYVLVYYPNFVALSQEPLEDILQRGYISQWLICGPFNTDMPEGIKNAVKNGQPPLGKRDYWENYGGITQILPQANVEHKIDNKNYNWYPISGNSHLIDLSQSTQNFDECIFFFASYFQAKEDKTLYINLQTPLGARVWLSKVKIIDTPQKFKIENAGIDKVLVRVRKGLNLVLLQIPFISLNSLSEITNVPQSEIQTKLWLEKEPGIGKTGFEFSFRILPTLQVGKIFYISVIQPTKIFTKTGIIPHQVFYLTLYNPYPENIYPVDISAYTIPEGNSILSKEISFLPKEEKILQVEVPLPSLPTTDNKKNIRFSISAPDEMGNTKSAEFTAEILTTQPEPTSKVFLITGIYGNYSNTKSYLERKKTSIEWCKNQIIYAQDNPNYGVDLSHSSVWLELLNYYPEFLVYLKNVVSKGRSSAQNGFGLVEDWFISPETMIRNIHWGTKLKQSILKDFQNIYQLWNCLG